MDETTCDSDRMAPHTRVYRGPLTGGFITYGIIDSRGGHFVYVGQTSNFEQRKLAHLQTTQSRPNYAGVNIKTWLWDALHAGVLPVIVVLETVATWQESLASETAWIRRLAAERHPLLNRWIEQKEVIREAATAKPEVGQVLGQERRAPNLAQRNSSGLELLPPHRPNKKKPAGLEHRGLAWTSARDHELVALYGSGMGAVALARELKRTRCGVRARLVRLGLIAERQDLPD